MTISFLWSVPTRRPGPQRTISRHSRQARTPATTRSSAAVVLNRDASGKVDVAEHDSGAHVAGGAVLGGTAGLVVGLFAPPLLAAAAVGAGIGAVVGKLSKKHEEKQMGVEMEEYLPPGTSAVVAVVDDTYADRVEAALVNSDKRINKAIDKDDYDELQKALADSSDEVTKAVNS